MDKISLITLIIVFVLGLLHIVSLNNKKTEESLSLSLPKSDSLRKKYSLIKGIALIVVSIVIFVLSLF